MLEIISNNLYLKSRIGFRSYTPPSNGAPESVIKGIELP